jgi:hypothetical protein
MAQISRPFQIALAAVVLLGGIWLFALQGDSKSGGSSSQPAASSPPKSAAQPSSSSSSASSDAATGGTTAPGVSGLSRAIAKAHGAVSTSEQNAHELQKKSEAASSTSNQTSESASAQTPAPAKATASTPARATPAPAKPKQAAVLATKQKTVESELRAGDVVVLLFWDRKGADDIAVHNAVRGLARGNRKIAVHESSARQVAQYGTVTRGVQVLGTPTVLVVGRHGKTKALTGLTDRYALQQAISEARKS